MLWIIVSIVVAGTVIWLLVYMLAQKPVTNVQQLIQAARYEDAIVEADRQLAERGGDGALHLHRAEALKLVGRFEEAIDSYQRSDDPAAREGIALSLAHQGKDLERAQNLMEETIARFPQIQEFQALALAFIHLRRGDRDAALRLLSDNEELIETRFRDDYTDRDPLLAETLYMYAELLTARGEARAVEIRQQAARYAPNSVWAR